ncbi:MAG: alpha/beta hydrolase [Verrucomicrobiota bacterium]|nr:alpha/beta hydrolase [Verrucomicrobiota bacterium]
MPLVLTVGVVTAQEEVVPLYEGPAPGSESWTRTEQESVSNLWNTRIVFNVTRPTLTVFRPDPARANGTAVIICPGGAFFALSIDREGRDVARWLAQRGVTAFVLKYRLVPCETDDPTRELMTRGPLDPIVALVVKLALGDGLTAVRLVRSRAAEFGVNPRRIGILGFSAGGTVATSVAFHFDTESRPDFVAPIYLAYHWVPREGGVPKDGPPMFIVAATDDPLRLASHSVELYQDWTRAGHSAELHLYARGGHGFGMRKQNLPSDHWIERFAEWLEMHGWMKR